MAMMTASPCPHGRIIVSTQPLPTLYKLQNTSLMDNPTKNVLAVSANNNDEAAALRDMLLSLTVTVRNGVLDGLHHEEFDGVFPLLPPDAQDEYFSSPQYASLSEQKQVDLILKYKTRTPVKTKRPAAALPAAADDIKAAPGVAPAVTPSKTQALSPTRQILCLPHSDTASPASTASTPVSAYTEATASTAAGLKTTGLDSTDEAELQIVQGSARSSIKRRAAELVDEDDLDEEYEHKRSKRVKLHRGVRERGKAAVLELEGRVRFLSSELNVTNIALDASSKSLHEMKKSVKDEEEDRLPELENDLIAARAKVRDLEDEVGEVQDTIGSYALRISAEENNKRALTTARDQQKARLEQAKVDLENTRRVVMPIGGCVPLSTIKERGVELMVDGKVIWVSLMRLSDIAGKRFKRPEVNTIYSKMIEDGGRLNDEIKGDRCDRFRANPEEPEFAFFRNKDVLEHYNLSKYFTPFCTGTTNVKCDKYRLAFYLDMTIDCILDDDGFLKRMLEDRELADSSFIQFD